jgi:hypothetical protein
MICAKKSLVLHILSIQNAQYVTGTYPSHVTAICGSWKYCRFQFQLPKIPKTKSHTLWFVYLIVEAHEL